MFPSIMASTSRQAVTTAQRAIRMPRALIPISARLSSRKLSTSSLLMQPESTSSQPPSTSAQPPAAKAKAPKKPISSCPAGTKMTGLSILKDQPDPVALPEEEYPAWLWTLLDHQSGPSESADRPDVRTLRSEKDFKEEKKRLRSVVFAVLSGKLIGQESV